MLISLTKENYLPVFIINGRHTDRPSVSVCVSGGGKNSGICTGSKSRHWLEFYQNGKRGYKEYVFTEKNKKGQKYLYSFFFMIQKGYICTLQRVRLVTLRVGDSPTVNTCTNFYYSHFVFLARRVFLEKYSRYFYTYLLKIYSLQFRFAKTDRTNFVKYSR